MRLEQLLVERGLCTREQIDEVIRTRDPEFRLDQEVVRRGLIKEPELLGLLGDALALDVVSLGDRKLESDVLGLVPSKLIFKSQVVPIERRNGSLVVATRNPFDVFSLDELGAKTGLHIEPVLAPQDEINAVIKNHFGVGGETVGALVGDGAFQVLDDERAGDDADEMAEEASVVKLVNEILFEAIEQRTSDIHIEPLEKGLRIRYRVDGVLQIQPMPPEIRRFAPAIVSRLKIMAKLNIAEKRLPQDGRIALRARGRDIDIRVSIIPMANGEGVVLRVLDKGGMKYDLRGIGMAQDHYELWRKLIELPHGILLVTGPTGSGKSTTLYSALQEIATEDIKIITVEDPVEYHFEKIQQIQVHPKIGLTFAAGLRAILRHDPDVVLVGEIRDKETAEISTQAALTGHLVLSTLHTNDAPSAFTRLTDMGVEPFLVASTVEAVMAQRLVRVVCKDCAKTYVPERAELPLDFPGEAGVTELRRGTGCRNCRQNGFRGRSGLYELLPISDPVRELCVRRASSAAIKTQALIEGMVTLRKDAWRKVLAGVTTVDEIARVTKSDEGFSAGPRRDTPAAMLAREVAAALAETTAAPENPEYMPDEDIPFAAGTGA
jgi:general secretion pathway protein E/type IV pilus assembly protein PilB